MVYYVWYCSRVFWVGPLVGSSLAAVIWRFVVNTNPDPNLNERANETFTDMTNADVELGTTNVTKLR